MKILVSLGETYEKEYIELTINSMCFFKFASVSYLANY